MKNKSTEMSWLNETIYVGGRISGKSYQQKIIVEALTAAGWNVAVISKNNNK
jgi:phage terminase large subunit